MTAYIYRLTSSEEFATRDLIVREYVDAPVYGTLRFLTPIPVGPRLAGLIDAVAAANHIKGRMPRDQSLRTTGAIRRAVEEIIRSPPEVRNSTVIVLLPQVATLARAVEGGEARGVLRLGRELTTKARAKVVAAVGRMAPAIPRRIRTLAAILREYQLYTPVRGEGKEVAVLADDDLDDLLSDILSGTTVEPEGAQVVAENVEAEPACVEIVEALPPPSLPFRNFPVGALRGHADNCIIDALVATYAVGLAPSKRIAKTRIEEWFSDSGTTLERLHAFCERYHIPLRVYDVIGAEIYALHHSIVGGKAHGRPGLSVIAHANHAYIGTGSVKNRPETSSAAECTIPCYADSRRPSGGEFSALEEEALGLFLKLCQPNFTFRAETAAGPVSLRWHEEQPKHVAGRHTCGPEENCACGNVCLDMKKAFHTAAMLADKKGAIPVFTIMDDIELVERGECTPFGTPSSEVTYYYVSRECLARWGSSGIPYLRARCNNIVHGLEAPFLAKHGHLAHNDIIAQKTASYSITVKQFHDAIASVDAAVGTDTVRERFYFYNGLLGRTATRSHRVQLKVSESDAELLAAVHASCREEECEDGHRLLTIEVAQGTPLHLNTRHLYDWVIARTNLVMSEVLQAVREDVPAAVVRKVRVDGIVFDRPVALRAGHAEHFKAEGVNLDWLQERPKFVDPATVMSGVKAEIAEFIQTCTTYIGAPGTGKTTKVQKEHNYDYAVAMTNVCARNLDSVSGDVPVKGETIYSRLHLYDPRGLKDAISSLRGKTLWVDEFSMIKNHIWGALYSLGRLGLKGLILTGDPNQTGPVGESLDYGSEFMRQLLAASEELTVDYRNDPQVVKLRTLVRDESSQVVRRFMGELSKAPQRTLEIPVDALARIDTHLVYTNRARAAINAMVLEHRGLRWESVSDAKSPKRKGVATARKWRASEGILLRARRTRKADGIYRGGLYILDTEVTHATGTFAIRRRSMDPSKPHGDPVRLPVSLMAFFEPGYAFTVHSCQGLTIHGPIALYQVSKMIRIGDGLLYTAITRICKMDQLRLSMDIPTSMNAYYAEANAESNELPGYLLTMLGCDDDFEDSGFSKGLEWRG